MQFTGARAFGPALAGLVLAQFGPGTAFMANALSFLLVIGALLLIAARPVTHTGSHGSVLAHFRDGVRYVRKRDVLVVAVLGALLSSLLGVSMIQLAEPFTRQVLHEGAGRYGLLVAAYGAGAIVGSIVTVARGDAFRRSTLTIIGFAIFVAGEVAFGLAPAYAIALLGLFGIGLAQVLAMVSCQTALQVNVDEHYRGRVLSIYVMCFFAGTPVGCADRRHRRRGDRAARHHRRLGRAPGRCRSGSHCSGTAASACSTSRASGSTTPSRPRPRATCTAPTSTPPPTSSWSRWTDQRHGQRPCANATIER